MNFFRSALMIILFSALPSCHGDTEDEATGIQYRVVADESILHEVTYRSDEGMVTEDSLSHMTMWYTTELVDTDFEAHLKATFINSGNVDKSYKLSCFVDGTQVSVKEGTIAPLTEKTEEINHSVLD